MFISATRPPTSIPSGPPGALAGERRRPSRPRPRRASTTPCFVRAGGWLASTLTCERPRRGPGTCASHMSRQSMMLVSVTSPVRTPTAPIVRIPTHPYDLVRRQRSFDRCGYSFVICKSGAGAREASIRAACARHASLHQEVDRPRPTRPRRRAVGQAALGWHAPRGAGCAQGRAAQTTGTREADVSTRACSSPGTHLAVCWTPQRRAGAAARRMHPVAARHGEGRGRNDARDWRRFGMSARCTDE
jgi:hypothetical protein